MAVAQVVGNGVRRVVVEGVQGVVCVQAILKAEEELISVGHGDDAGVGPVRVMANFWEHGMGSGFRHG